MKEQLCSLPMHHGNQEDDEEQDVLVVARRWADRLVRADVLYRCLGCGHGWSDVVGADDRLERRVGAVASHLCSVWAPCQTMCPVCLTSPSEASVSDLHTLDGHSRTTPVATIS